MEILGVLFLVVIAVVVVLVVVALFTSARDISRYLRIRRM